MINRAQSLFLVGALALALLASALAASPIENTANISFTNAAGVPQTAVRPAATTDFLRLSLAGAAAATVEAGLTGVQTATFANTVTNSGSLNDSYQVVVTRPVGNTWAARIVDFAGTAHPLDFSPGLTSVPITLGEIIANRTSPTAATARDFRLEVDVVNADHATNYDFIVQVESTTRPVLQVNVTNQVTTRVSAVDLRAVMTVSGDIQPAAPPVPAHTWAGGELVYTVVITNHGPGLARDVVFTNPIPANTTYVPGSMTLGGASLTDDADADRGAFAAGTNTITIAVGEIQPNQSITITYRVTVNQ